MSLTKGLDITATTLVDVTQLIRSHRFFAVLTVKRAEVLLGIKSDVAHVYIHVGQSVWEMRLCDQIYAHLNTYTSVCENHRY